VGELSGRCQPAYAILFHNYLSFMLLSSCLHRSCFPNVL